VLHFHNPHAVQCGFYEVFEMNEERHWGQQLLKLLDSLDMNGWDALGTDDPVEWVKAVRQQELSRLDAYWNGTEEDSEEDSM
jgi:hypothetical protein